MMLEIVLALVIALIGSPTTAYLTTRHFTKVKESPLLLLSKRANVFKINFVDVTPDRITFDQDGLSNFKYDIYSLFNTQGDIMEETTFVQLRQQIINGINSLKLEFHDSRSHAALRDFLKECVNTYPRSEFPVVLNIMINLSLTLISRIK